MKKFQTFIGDSRQIYKFLNMLKGSNGSNRCLTIPIIPSLTILINASIKQAIFPTELSQKILPFHKDGSKLDLNNYRAIALLLTLGKIFERVMFNRIYNYLEQFNFIYCKQFGYRIKHNTIDAIAEVTTGRSMHYRKGIGGGVMMQLKDNVTIIEEFNSELAESISVLVKLNNEIFQKMLVYNPPNDNKFTFVDEFDKHLEAISNKNYRAVICGDFNINILKSNNLSSRYIDAVENNGFNQLIKQPTRVGYNSETLLDHMIVKDVNVKAAYALENQSFSDRFPIILELNTQTSKKICPKIYRD